MKRRTGFMLGFIVVAVLRCTAGSVTTAPAQRPSPLRYRLECRSDPPQRLHILTVDLTDPRVTLRVALGGEANAGPWTTVLERPSFIARREGFAATINANSFTSRDVNFVFGQRVPYFVGNPAIVVHWCMTDGRLINAEPPQAALIVDDDGHVRIGRFDRIDPKARQIAGGFGPIVHAGRNVAEKAERAPRTAAGIDATGRTLVLLVIDGRRSGFAAGMTPPEIANEMIRLGCTEALAFDGGGSSAMVLSDAVEGCPKPATAPANAVEAPDRAGPWVVNRPSDGHDLLMPISIERPVACVLGITLRP
jgi:hypothetical protein